MACQTRGHHCHTGQLCAGAAVRNHDRDSSWDPKRRDLRMLFNCAEEAVMRSNVLRLAGERMRFLPRRHQKIRTSTATNGLNRANFRSGGIS